MKFNAEQHRAEKHILEHNMQKANAYQPHNDTVCGRMNPTHETCIGCEHYKICRED